MQQDPIGFFSELAATQGDVAEFALAGRRAFLVGAPTLIEEVLVTHQRKFVKGPALRRARQLFGRGVLTSEGEQHRRQRRIVMPAFHQQRVTMYADTISSYAASRCADWKHGRTLDIVREMNDLTLDIVAKTLFGTEFGSSAGEVRRAITWAVESFDLFGSTMADSKDSPAAGGRMRRFRAARTSLDAIVNQMIESRRAKSDTSMDLMSLLLAARREDTTGSLDDDWIRDEILTMLLAGHETTANALSWVWYLLGSHPHVEARLHAELDEALGGRTPGVADVPRLIRTRHVFQEALRLYPSAWVIARLAVEEHEFGATRIPADALVVISPFLVHRDPRFFPNPTAFDPDRWQQDEPGSRPKCAYLPFGAGPRGCIGETFAWMEGILVVATIAAQWTLRPLAVREVSMEPRFTLRPRHGIQMTAERRSQPSK
jgi:cytochrome P450